MIVRQPLVSILINNYNYASYLNESINSALNQTYSNTEVIVVDDGSTDDSQEIIKIYGEKITPVLKKNVGQASAFNAGFAIAQGEIISILDSDDVWLPQKVEQVVQAMDNYPNASVIYHKVQNIYGVGTKLGKPWPPYSPIRGDIASQVAQTGGWWPFPPSTGLSFSRKFLSEVMEIPEEEYRICADTYLADLAPFFGDVVGIDDVLSLFRLHGSNNWSYPLEHKKRSLHYHELRVRTMNQVLQDSGINVAVSLADNLPYQRLKHKLGESTSFIALSLLILRNPWELRLTSKLKAIGELSIERLKTELAKT